MEVICAWIWVDLDDVIELVNKNVERDGESWSESELFVTINDFKEVDKLEDNFDVDWDVIAFRVVKIFSGSDWVGSILIVGEIKFPSDIKSGVNIDNSTLRSEDVNGKSWVDFGIITVATSSFVIEELEEQQDWFWQSISQCFPTKPDWHWQV